MRVSPLQMIRCVQYLVSSGDCLAPWALTALTISALLAGVPPDRQIVSPVKGPSRCAAWGACRLGQFRAGLDLACAVQGCRPKVQALPEGEISGCLTAWEAGQ